MDGRTVPYNGPVMQGRRESRPGWSRSMRRRLGYISLARSAVLLHPVFGAAGMRLQSFAICEFRGDLAERLRAFRADFDHARALEEIVDAKRRGEPCGTRRRQHVIRPRAVVAEAFAGVAAKEDRASMADQLSPLVGLHP